LGGGFGGAALWAGLSGGIAIILPLLMFVAFARVLPPLVIGQFALAVALSELLKCLGVPGLYEVILHRQDPTGRDQAAAQGVFLVMGLALVPVHLLLLYSLLAMTSSQPGNEAAWLLGLVALRIPLDLMLLQPQAELARRQAHARLAQRNIMANIGAGLLGLAGIVAADPMLGLGLYTLGLSVCTAAATVVGTRAWRWPIWAPDALRQMRAEALLASAVRGASVALMQMDQVALGGLLGPIAFAFYNVGKRIEMALVSLAQSFAQALFQPLFAARRGLTERAAVLRQALGIVTVTCGAGAAVFIATADLVIALLLGPEWAPAAPVAALLAVAGHGRALASACASLLSVCGQNSKLLRVFLVSAGVGLAMVALAAPFGALAVALAVTLRVLATTLLLAWMTRAAAGDGWRGAMLHALLGFLGMLAVAMLARSAVVSPGGVASMAIQAMAVLAACCAVAPIALVMLLRLAPRGRMGGP
jgi:PST family polysaccharide transporter